MVVSRPAIRKCQAARLDGPPVSAGRPGRSIGPLAPTRGARGARSSGRM